MKFLIPGLWLGGALLIALGAGSLALGEMQRQRDIEVLGQAMHRVPLQLPRSPPASPEMNVLEAAMAIPVSGALPLALPGIPRIGLEVPAKPGTGEAAHYDHHFRALEELVPGDFIVLDTTEPPLLYRVATASAVDPYGTGVLAATAEPGLALVACYPLSRGR